MAVVLITGANRGIGLALCKEYVSRGDEVLAVCRKSSKELKELNLEIFDDIDVTKESNRISEKLGGKKIDILINNAGILRIEAIENFNFETILEQFEVNSLGPLKVTMALLENLVSGSKIAMITSRMGSIADNERGGHYGYRMSKAALNAASTSLAKDLVDQGIAIGIIHPGYVKTDMTGYAGLIETPESAEGIIQRIDELTAETSGTFWHSNGEILPW